MLQLVPSLLCYSTYTTACTLRSLNIITMKTIFRIVCIALMCTYSLSLAADDSVMVLLSDLRALEARIAALEAQSKQTDALSGATLLVTDSLQSAAQAAAVAAAEATVAEAVAAEKAKPAEKAKSVEPKKEKGLVVGGYGEAAIKRCFYSNNYLRYTSPETYANDQYGEFDLPHVVIYLGYNFGKGWSMGSEIEFEHGGVEAAVEIEDEEGGEYETEVERGGEVALEQFWIQKSFTPYANLRAGMLIVPLGGTNAHHEPDQFFGVYRPEGDNTILPCTWHDIGLQFHGRYRWLGYTAQFLPGLESARFGSKNWIHYGSASAYEFKLANCYAGLVRLDFYPLIHTSENALRLSVSGYTGTSFRNNLQPTSSQKYEGVKGLVSLAAIDWRYSGHGLIFRGSAVYGHLSDAEQITAYNKSMSKNSISKRQNVASDAYSAGAEIGFDFFSLSPLLRQKQQFYLFARYDIYDAQARINASRNYWAGRQKVSAGFNYFPLPQIIIKGEFGYGILNQNPFASVPYNNEPYIAFSVNYSGFFHP